MTTDDLQPTQEFPDMIGGVPKLTKEQAAIIGLYTGVVCGPFSDVHEYAEKIMGRPIWTHQFPAMEAELKAKAKPDFLAMCYDAVWAETAEIVQGAK